MKSTSRAVVVAGAIMIAILLVAIGMYTYNSASSTITDSMSSFAAQEVQAFNNNFESYGGEQRGSNVNALITRLIANAKTYHDESTKVPDVYGPEDVIAQKSPVDEECEIYIDNLTKFKNSIDSKKNYNIEFSYGSTGLIDIIYILNEGQTSGVKGPASTSYSSGFEEDDDDDEEDTLSTVSDVEIQAFNAGFETYEGLQTGSNVNALISRLIASYKANGNNPERVPTVYEDKNSYKASYDDGNYTDTLMTMKNNIENKHTYRVNIEYNNKGYIDTITIKYDAN